MIFHKKPYFNYLKNNFNCIKIHIVMSGDCPQVISSVFNTTLPLKSVNILNKFINFMNICGYTFSKTSFLQCYLHFLLPRSFIEMCPQVSTSLRKCNTKTSLSSTRWQQYKTSVIQREAFGCCSTNISRTVEFGINSMPKELEVQTTLKIKLPINVRKKNLENAQSKVIEASEVEQAFQVARAGTSKFQKKGTKRAKNCPMSRKDEKKYRMQRDKANIRCQKYRAKLTEEQKAAKRAQDKEYYKRKKETGLVKSISEKSDREKRKLRKNWREASRRYREKRENLNNSLSTTLSETDSCNTPTNSSSSRCIVGRKKVALNRSMVRRKLQKMEKENIKLKKKLEKYKKRLSRHLHKTDEFKSPSPRRKVKSLLKNKKVPTRVKKSLIFGEVIKKQLKRNLEVKCKTHKEKQSFYKYVGGKILKKYKMLQLSKSFLRNGVNKKFLLNQNLSRKTRSNATADHLKTEIRKFYENDKSSRMCPSKRDYITRKGMLRQKRLLIKPIRQIWKEFVEEMNIKISYVTFSRLRPFWIVPPKLRDRQTCLCIKHENISFIVTKLYYLKIINCKNAQHLTSKDLENCTSNITERLTDTISYDKWENTYVKKRIRGEEKKIRIMAKSTKTCTVNDLIEEAKIELPKFKKHVTIMLHQAKTLTDLKSNLKENELIVQIDFAENYVLKMHKEVQSMHFGASQKQICLHTGVAYFSENKNVRNISFCSVSSNLDHQAHAIWAHLKIAFEKLTPKLPIINKVHFFSDGPTGQYRNRFNINLLMKMCPMFFPNLQETTWNFACSGHGKGPMDGIGGHLKRTADTYVLHGGDICSAKDFVELFKTGSVEVILLPDDDVTKIKSEIDRNAPMIPEIFQVHQIRHIVQENTAYINTLSCFECHKVCQHYSHHVKSSLNYVVNSTSENKAPVNFKTDDWVAVIFNDKWYPGLIEKIDGAYLDIIFMKPAGKKKFNWPLKTDRQRIFAENVMCKMPNPPFPVSSRHFMFSDEHFKHVDSIFNNYI